MRRLLGRVLIVGMMAGLFHSGNGYAFDNEVERVTLEGLEGMSVILDISPVVLLSDLELQTVAERRLRSHGLPILTDDQAFEIAGKPFLSIALNAIKAQSRRGHMLGYVFTLEVRLYQQAHLERNGLLVPTPTWSGTPTLNTTHQELLRREVLKALQMGIDEFARAYRAVNPQRRRQVPLPPDLPPVIPQYSSQQISQVQAFLKTAGYDPGPADGQLGPKTRGALRAYQQANGLSPTGELDDETWEKLGLE